MLGRTSNVVKLGSSLLLVGSSHKFDLFNRRTVELVSALNTEAGDFVSKHKVGAQSVPLDGNDHARKMSPI